MPAKTPDPLDTLIPLLILFNMTTVARQLSELLAAAEQTRPSYTEFLHRLLEAEENARWERKTRRLVRRAHLGPAFDLDRFDWAIRPDLSPQVVKELLTCRFIDERRNLILVGRPSTGKTTIADTIGHAACQRGHSVYAVTMQEMLEELHAARADASYRKVYRRVTRPDLLVIDDAGFAEVDRTGANELFRVVCERHRKRSTIVITNLPFKKWGEFLPSAAQAVAIADRLVDQATILRFSGKPCRNPRDIHGAPLEDEDQ